jgi:hypothetical protein
MTWVMTPERWISRPIWWPISDDNSARYFASSGVITFSRGILLRYILSREWISLPLMPDMFP